MAKPQLLSDEAIHDIQKLFTRFLGDITDIDEGRAIAQAQVDKMIEQDYKKVEEVELPRILVDPTLTHVECVRKAKEEILKLGKFYKEVEDGMP